MKKSLTSPSGTPTGTGIWSKFFREALEQVDRPGWKRFILSMAALVVAFLLAVYSSVFAQQGNVMATGICATLALGLSGYVAITAVPYLARRTRLEWLRISTDYKLTRDGYIFIILIFVIAVAGMNTGNNLLYLILASMLAAILVSGVLSLAVLSGVELEILLPEHVFARRSMHARIHLRNHKKRMPSFSISMSGAGNWSTQAAVPERSTFLKKVGKLALVGVGLGILAALVSYVLLQAASEWLGLDSMGLVPFILIFMVLMTAAMVGIHKSQRWRRTRRRGSASQIRSGPALSGLATSAEVADRRILRDPLYFPFLPGGGLVSRSVELKFPRRGLYREDGFTLSTRFPFGFLEKKARLPVRRDLWVYPSVTPTDAFHEILPVLSGEIEAYQKGRGHDLYSIREMQPTDSARHVDWKASARTGSPKVREFAREDSRRLQLILDDRIGKADPHIQSWFEYAVEFCACLAWHFHQAGFQMQFRCGDFRTPVGANGELIYEVLRFLAKVEPVFETPLSPMELPAEEDVFRIVCSALPRESLRASHGDQSHFVCFETLVPTPETMRPDHAVVPVGLATVSRG
jgi:uncharacterized protein (DUF58 family)